MLVSGVRMTVLSGREGMTGGQEAGGGRLEVTGSTTKIGYSCTVAGKINYIILQYLLQWYL